jgi:hypothetical protein
MPNKDNNNITQRRKSFVKSKTLTDKVRSPVPDNIPVQRPKNMIKHTVLYFKAKIAKHGKKKNDKDEI